MLAFLTVIVLCFCQVVYSSQDQKMIAAVGNVHAGKEYVVWIGLKAWQWDHVSSSSRLQVFADVDSCRDYVVPGRTLTQLPYPPPLYISTKLEVPSMGFLFTFVNCGVRVDP